MYSCILNQLAMLPEHVRENDFLFPFLSLSLSLSLHPLFVCMYACFAFFSGVKNDFNTMRHSRSNKMTMKWRQM